jgi:hypothetical protein
MNDLAAELAALRAFTINHLAAIEESLAETNAVVARAHSQRLAARADAIKAAACGAGAAEEAAGEIARKLLRDLDIARQTANRPPLRR